MLDFFFLAEEADDLEAAAGAEALDCCGVRADAANDALAESEDAIANANDAVIRKAWLGSLFIGLRFSSVRFSSLPLRG